MQESSRWDATGVWSMTSGEPGGARRTAVASSPGGVTGPCVQQQEGPPTGLWVGRQGAHQDAGPLQPALCCGLGLVP